MADILLVMYEYICALFKRRDDVALGLKCLMCREAGLVLEVQIYIYIIY